MKKTSETFQFFTSPITEPSKVNSFPDKIAFRSKNKLIIGEGEDVEFLNLWLDSTLE